MLIRRITTHLRSRHWLALGLDLLVVVVGIFLGFQVDRWYEGQRNIAVERTYLERLQADIEAERDQFQEIVNRSIPCFVRQPRGREIYAACGQLKRTDSSS